MNVIFVLCSRGAGGAERHLLQLMQGLSHQGIACTYAGPVDGWLGRQLQQAGFRCVDIPFRGVFDVISIIRLARLIRREKADLVHGHLTRGAFYVGLAAKLAGVPNVATAHSTNAGKRFGRATRIIAVADAVQRFLVQCGYPPERILTVRNGIPDPVFEPQADPVVTRTELKLGEGPVIAMVARFLAAKGQDIALRALSMIQDRPWTLVLAGGLDNDYARQMQELASSLGIANRVRFIGHRDDVASLYACTDILLAPSRREAFSLTLLEASAFSIPIIAADVGGIGEAVIPEVTGKLVPPEDPAALASAIASLLDDAGLRERLGRAGRERYLRHFTQDAMIRGTINVYQEALAGELREPHPNPDVPPGRPLSQDEYAPGDLLRHRPLQGTNALPETGRLQRADDDGGARMPQRQETDAG